ncbi:MAG: hypothetical protein JJ975_04070 [Bacteroidia bacterium]|nr:hypothetical protein [Bacteroidia bacterium]
MTLKLGYIALTVFMFLLLIRFGNHAINKSAHDQQDKTRKKRTLLIAMLLWQVYVLALGSSGFLASFDLPPRMPLLLILPLFTFIAVFLSRNKAKKWIQTIPTLWLTGLQSFRIVVETLFVFSVTAGILHENVTILGYNYDMIVGLTAPIMALVIYRSKTTPKKLLIAWNFFGIAVLACTVFVFLSTAFFPNIYGFETTPLSTDFGIYPYVLIPGFLMPTAIFVHVLSIVQLRRT